LIDRFLNKVASVKEEMIVDPELQCPLLHHGFVHLYPSEISVVHAACVGLRAVIFQTGSFTWAGTSRL